MTTTIVTTMKATPVTATYDRGRFEQFIDSSRSKTWWMSVNYLVAFYNTDYGIFLQRFYSKLKKIF